MIFTYKEWEKFCQRLSDYGLCSITAKDVMLDKPDAPYLILKHDVETNVKSALNIAKIENKYGHKGSYYVQAYLLKDANNTNMLLEIQSMGHEISYHYDVMDSALGDIEKASAEFEANKKLFEENGFALTTLCQHGNPVIERKGYTSNRDFFRNPDVQKKYADLADIMVDFKTKAETDYEYFSDAGRQFNLIFDPINNDIIKSDDKNIPFNNLEKLYEYFSMNKDKSFIVSTHPHRWVSSKTKYIIKSAIFKTVRFVAKLLIKIPLFKRIMSKYYFLAKKL